MIVTDMDGTFLNDQDGYNLAHFEQVYQRIQAKGIKFVVASGSQYQRLQNQFDAIRQTIDFISQNGAVIHSGNRLVDFDEIDPQDLAQTLNIINNQFAADTILQHTISGVKRTYVDSQTPAEVIEIVKRYYNAVQLVDDFAHLSNEKVDDHLTKVGVTFASDNFAQNVKMLRSDLPQTLMSQNSGFNTELIGNVGVNKETAIQKLQQRYNIANDEIATFGDDENDLEMLTMTPYGFAMPTAAPIVKAQVTQTTVAGNNDDGVLKTIDELI